MGYWAAIPLKRSKTLYGNLAMLLKVPSIELVLMLLKFTVLMDILLTKFSELLKTKETAKNGGSIENRAHFFFFFFWKSLMSWLLEFASKNLASGCHHGPLWEAWKELKLIHTQLSLMATSSKKCKKELTKPDLRDRLEKGLELTPHQRPFFCSLTNWGYNTFSGYGEENKFEKDIAERQLPKSLACVRNYFFFFQMYFGILVVFLAFAPHSLLRL